MDKNGLAPPPIETALAPTDSDRVAEPDSSVGMGDEAATWGSAPVMPKTELVPNTAPPTVHVEGRDSAGRFLTGNIGGGRPRGSRNRITELWMSALAMDFAEYGLEAIEAVRLSDPAAYLRIVGSFVPRELVVQREREPEVDIESLSLTEFVELIERLERHSAIRKALLAAECG